MYHGIDTRAAGADPDNLFVPAESFAAQLRWLITAGWHPLDVDGYLARRGPARSFLVTFDDGYVSVGRIAGPILVELGVPAVCFVCPGRLGERSTWMTEQHEALMDREEVRALPGMGIEVGAHGWDHTALPGLAPDSLARHTRQAGQALAELTGRWPRCYAYPYGAHDVAARTAVAATGYSVGFATYDADGPMAVPRVDVNSLDTCRSFRMKTWRTYPAMRRVLSRAPALRSAVHTVIGHAGRDTAPGADRSPR
jgi:peptidoglycan/xylan/chitin deacetylase (PgdA/CDA1 family)